MDNNEMRPKPNIPINDLDNYPNASLSKQSQNKPKTKPKEDAIIDSSRVQLKKESAWKKAKHRIFEQEFSELKDYICNDVIIPAIKNVISDSISNGIEILLYGDARRPRRSGQNIGGNKIGGRGYYTYNTLNSRVDPRTRPPINSSSTVRDSLSLDNFIFQTKYEAREVLDRLSTILNDYDIVTVADLYDICGLSSPYTYNNYAWRDLSTAGITLTRDGYLLNLPTPQSLD